MTIKAWLDGDSPDLEYLAAMLPSGDAYVAREGDRFYLASDELETLPAGEQFYDGARKLITRINGLARSQNPAFVPVGLTDSYDQDGGVTVVGATAHLVVRATFTATAQVIGPDGLPPPQAPLPGPGRLMLAARNADVAEVLEIMGSPDDPHFADLYKVWEIIRHAGGLETAMQSAGIPNNAMTRFTRSANHQAASGDKARHARSAQAPPGKPMPISEARAMMGNLVSAWMDSL